MFTEFANHPILLAVKRLLATFKQVGNVYLVGGAVRDALLGRMPVDFDFSAEHDPTPLAQALARQLDGHWFWLDRQRRQSRVIVGAVTCDFAPFRAPTLAGDLAARDFTINAMAIDLVGAVSDVAFTDPCGGRADLSAGILRCAGPGVLDDDPLRILKGIRHAVELDLTIEPATLCAMQTAVVRLPVMAPERLRIEMWRILAAPAVQQGLGGLVESGAGAALFGPELRVAAPFICGRMLDSHALFVELSATIPAVANWLQEPVEQGLDRATLLRWHFLFDVIDKGLPLTLARRWRFSRLALDRLDALQRIGPELWQELRTLPLSPRPVALWARQYSPDPIDLLLALGLLPQGALRPYREDLETKLRLLAELPDPRQVPPLIAGGWLQNELGMEGEAIGSAQADLCRAEIRGEVRDAGEACRYLLARHPKNG